jgi:hypothetical protein
VRQQNAAISTIFCADLRRHDDLIAQSIGYAAEKSGMTTKSPDKDLE